MEIEDLRREVSAQFEQVDQRFEQMEQRFEQVDRRFDRMDGQFAELKAELLQSIADEGARTRRHFETVAEQMRSERNHALDQSAAAIEQVGRVRASNAADHLEFERRLDDHDARLTRLERRRR
jgi:predicted transcriptional regulator